MSDTALHLDAVAHCCGAKTAYFEDSIQQVWSGYGEIERYQLTFAGHTQSCVVKRIRTPSTKDHPRGWNTDFGHQRKLQSYINERKWYQNHNAHMRAPATTAKLLGEAQLNGQYLLVLEDLNALGYYPKQQVSQKHIRFALEWLAYFHAYWLNRPPADLWQQGNYWHLATRPQEWQTMDDSALKDKAQAIDEQLKQAQHQTLIHGDAKWANFCFSDTSAAAVDFQYIGAGAGCIDVMYFLSSVYFEDELLSQHDAAFDYYFERLSHFLGALGIAPNEVINEWRQLTPFAWADFKRFLRGWSPGHKKDTLFSRQQTQYALAALNAKT